MVPDHSPERTGPAMKKLMTSKTCCFALAVFLSALPSPVAAETAADDRPRVIVTTDGEADDRCSMVRFLLTANEFEVEGIVNSSSQFHWEGGEGWNALEPSSWVEDQIGLYAQVYENLLLHDLRYPSPESLLSKWKVGNISSVGEDRLRTPGAELIAKVLLDSSDARPVWVQAWGGCNTISRALKIVQEDHPSKMKEVARKLRLFLIWEQDETYQNYIRPNWEHLGVTTIISDQFDCLAYIWPKVLPDATQQYFQADWMQQHLLKGHGPLCTAYEVKEGAFQAEGDTPAFLHVIPSGLRSHESPAWGGWGGRYVKVRNNVWMDPPPDESWQHPQGRWHIENSWSKKLENAASPRDQQIRSRYFKPIWRWLGHVQNDFAARADWCVQDYPSANHHPIVVLKETPLGIQAKVGEEITLDASATTDPDGDALRFRWWHYQEAGTYAGPELAEAKSAKCSIAIPSDVKPGNEIHMICEVTDHGEPPLTRYQRVVIRVGVGK